MIGDHSDKYSFSSQLSDAMRLISQLIVSSHLLMEASVNHSIGSSYPTSFLHPKWCSNLDNSPTKRTLSCATPRVVQVPVKKCSTCSLVKRIRRKWDGQGLMNSPGTKLQKNCLKHVLRIFPDLFGREIIPWDCRSSYFVVTSSRILFDIVFSTNLLIWLPHSCDLDQL